MSARPDARPLTARLLAPPPADGMRIHWLGQAGFLVEAAGLRLLIDPYLSDSLAGKYAGTPFAHARMMAAPIAVDALPPIDLVFLTHRHTDHMDEATLRPLAARWPSCRFVVPAAETAEALARTGTDGDRLVPLDAGDRRTLAPGLDVRAVRAAHETLERDAEGRHRFLGYAVTAGGATLFHSGDTVPFPGQAEEVAALGADLALLPVNGRHAGLTRAGISGNMTLDEAAALCRQAKIPAMIAHHYGLFAFNTADPAAIDAAAERTARPRIARARLDRTYSLEARRG